MNNEQKKSNENSELLFVSLCLLSILSQQHNFASPALQIIILKIKQVRAIIFYIIVYSLNRGNAAL
jgi:hypothetical protein